MNIISRHISYLLLTCRKVCVPGLGTFTANFERASFDMEDCVFYPSKIRVFFSQDEISDNDLLINSIRRKQNYSNKETNKIVEEFVDLIRNKLNLRHYCRIEGVGYLMQDSRQNIFLKDTFWKSKKLPAFA